MTAKKAVAKTDDDTELSVLPPKQSSKTAAVAMLRQHASMMQDAYDLACRMVGTDLVPDRYRDKPDDATAAILYGGELGLSPIQSLQNVFAVNGSPAMYARTMAALLRARGYRFRTREKTSEAVEIHGWEPGHDPNTMAPDETSRWTMTDAQKAGYTKRSSKYPDRPSKYETEPRAMLYAKALAEVCRHLAPDILLGISYSFEELQAAADTPVRLTPAPVTAAEILGEIATDSPAAGEPLPAPAAGPDSSPPDAADSHPSGGEPETSGAGSPDVEQRPVPDPDEPPKPATRGQNRALSDLFDKLGLTDPQDRVIVSGAILGVDLTVEDRLSSPQIQAVTGQLKRWDKAGNADAKINDLLQSWAAAQTDNDGDQHQLPLE